MSGLESIFRADNFYALTFNEARPELERCMVSNLGIFPLDVADRPQTDGKKIFLQPRKAEFKDKKDEPHNNRNMSLYLSDLIHELLHIREGTFLVDGRPYLKKFGNEGLAHAIFNIVEDARIEHNAREHLKPEDIELLENSNRFLARKREFPQETQERFMDIYSTEMIVKERPSQFDAGKAKAENTTLETKVKEPILNAQGINNIGDLLQEAVRIGQEVYGRSVGASWEVVPRIYELITKAFPEIEKKFPSRNSPYATVEAPQHGKKKKEISKGQSPSQGAPGQPASGKPEEPNLQLAYTGFRGDVHDFSAAPRKGNSLEQLAEDEHDKDSSGLEDLSSAKVGGTGKPENAKGKTSSGWVKVVTYDHLKKAYVHLADLHMESYRGSNPEFLKELAQHSGIQRRIVEHFEALKPNQLQRIRFTEEPDELNMEAVAEVLADPSLRATARIYDSHVINERDSLTAVLLDISGSTDCKLASGKRVIDVEKLAAGLIYQGLTQVGDRVQMYAFSTDPLVTHLYTLKGLENLGALKPEHANADGVALRGVIADIKRIPAREKKIIMISDGRPVATGSSGDPVIDTSMAFGEAEAQGIRTVYFNVDNRPSDYFPKLVRNTTYARSLRDINQLPKVISDFVMEHG